MQGSTNNPDGDFQSLHRQLRNGRRSIDDFLGALGFERWLRGQVNHYDFLLFEGFYGPEDLRAESEVKVRKVAPELDPEIIPSQHAFFGWAKKVVYHTYLDALRKNNKNLRHGWTRSHEPIKESPAPDEDFEGKYFLGRFLEFIKRYRPERRFALMLWLHEGYSYREVEEALLEEGIKISRVTIGRWVIESVTAFKESLGLPRPERLPGLTGGARRQTADVARVESSARKTPAEALAEIAALPLEGASDPFSGREHDAVLYPRK